MHTEASSEKPLLAQASMSQASSGSSRRRWANQRTTRRRTCSVMEARASGVRAVAWRNWIPARRSRLEYTVEDAAVVVEVAIERGAKAVNEAHRPEACSCRGAGAAAAQMRLDHPQEDAQHRGHGPGFTLQEIAQALGYGQHPVSDRQGREGLIDQMRGGLDHAPGVARGADAAPLAGEGHQEGLAAGRATGAGEAVREYPAFEMAAA